MTIARTTQRAIVYSVLVSMAAGLVVAFSSYYDSLSSDAVVVYMASTIKWTPFYWGLDRFGMLIPAMTIAIRDPLSNMIAQNVLYVMTAILAFFLLAKYLFGHLDWKKIGLLSAIAFAALSSADDLKPFFTPYQNYTPAMVFGLLALMCARKRPVFSLALAVMAQYCNFAMIILMVFLAGAKLGEKTGRVGFRRVLSEALNLSLIFSFSAGIAYLIRQPYAQPSGQYGTLPWFDALTGWIGLLRDYHYTGSSWWLLLLPVAVAAYVAVPSLLLGETYSRHTHRSFWVGQVALFGWAFIVGGNIFAKWNGFPKRYLIPALMIWMVCWIALAVRHWPRQWSIPRFQLILPLVLLLVFVTRFGVPSPHAVKQSLEARFGKTYKQVRPTCTHITGDYYRAWDSSFYAMIKGQRTLWAITGRSQVTRELWSLEKFEDPRVCYWQDNETEALEMLKYFGVLDLKTEDVRDGIVSLTRNSKVASQAD